MNRVWRAAEQRLAGRRAASGTRLKSDVNRHALVLAAVCIPRFPADAASWLQQLRERYDPKHARLVPPHVTLVFPTDLLAEVPFVAHVVSHLRGANGGTVGFSSAREFEDASAGAHLVYLLPSFGAELLLQLHDKLNSGPLRPRPRSESQYLPHITLGRFSSADTAAAVAAEINETSNPITGGVDAVDIVHVSEDLVRHVHTERLRAG